MSRREKPKELTLEISLERDGEVAQPRRQSNWVAEKKEGLLRPM